MLDEKNVNSNQNNDISGQRADAVADTGMEVGIGHVHHESAYEGDHKVHHDDQHMGNNGSHHEGHSEGHSHSHSHHHSNGHSSHGSGSHSHHSHHHRRRKKRSRFHIDRKTLVIIAMAVLMVATLAFALLVDDMKGGFNSDLPENSSLNDNELEIKLINDSGILVASGVKQYLSADLIPENNWNVIPGMFLQEGEKLDEQKTVALKLSTKNVNTTGYTVEISTDSLFANSPVEFLNMSSGIYEFKHLYADTQYFYRVTAYTTEGIITKTGSFRTADTPRILSIEGVSNVRDIGNWKTDSGKRIKQGLLIRGTEIDGAVERNYHITNDGVVDMLTQFGIKTDIDLRRESILTKDALGAQVSHRYYDMVMYNGIFTDDGKEKIRSVFTDLADPDIYPVYLHCTYGNDRTGTVCYLLEALLGVSRGDCLKEYGLSNLALHNIMLVEQGLDSYAGETLKEKTEAYLMSCGISQAQIESIRTIFLGD